ncbi:unnamed protein product [Symbiodinium sp. CCMP2592]|nr:unnamed protein product [Symbiodinium sp. CCMP2592]
MALKPGPEEQLHVVFPSFKNVPEAKNQLFVSTEVQEAVASKATADQLAEGWLQCMAITPDGSRLFAISDNQIWRWSVCVEEKWPAAVEFLGVAQEQDDSERAAAPAETEVHESDDPALAFAEDAAAEPRRQLEDTPPRTQEQLRVALEAANVLLELAAADHGDRPGPP